MNDTKQFFYQNQRLLLKLANSEAGRAYLGIKDKDPIVKITSNSVHFLKGYKKDYLLIQADFYTNARFYNLLSSVITKMQIADEYKKIQDINRAFLHYLGLERGNFPQIFLTTTEFNDAITNFGILSSTSSVWATVRAGNNLSVGTWSDIATTGFGCLFDGTNYSIRRFFFHFDTSALTSAATITAGFVRVVGTTTNDQNVDGDSERLVSSSVSTDTSIATSDWGNVGSTDYGTIAFSGWNSSGNNDITLTAAGLEAISKTGYTKFAARSLRDINNTAPTGHNNETFTTDGAIISITYTLPSGGYIFIQA